METLLKLSYSEDGENSKEIKMNSTIDVFINHKNIGNKYFVYYSLSTCF